MTDNNSPSGAQTDDRASDGVRERPTLADEGRALMDDALLSRLVTFLAVVGASTPDDHPWVTESRALADAVSAARREAAQRWLSDVAPITRPIAAPTAADPERGVG